MSIAVDNRFNPDGTADFVLLVPASPCVHTAFKLHKERLASAPFFRDMFACATEEHPTQETFEGLPAIFVNESETSFIVHLGFLYDQVEEANLSDKSYGRPALTRDAYTRA